MILRRFWPWSRIAELERQLTWYRERERHLLFQRELHEKIAVKACSDLAGANKGIRRLVERLKRARGHHE